MVNHYIRFGKVQFNSIGNQSSMWPPTQRRSGRAAWDWTQRWKCFCFFSPTCFFLPLRLIVFIANPDLTVCERFRMEQERFGAVDLGKNNGSTISEKSVAVNDEEGWKKCPSTTTEKHVRPAAKHSFPVFVDKPIINSCSFFSHLPPFFHL